MKVCLSMFVVAMVTGCGSSKSSDTPNTNNLDKAVKLSVVGKTLYTEDNLYQASCNQFYFDFLSTNDYKCKTVKATVDVGNAWTIKSNNDTSVNISATQKSDKAVLTIGGKDYYCYVYSGSVFTSTGEQKYSGAHQILVSSTATKPSDLKGSDVYAIANSGQDVCDAMF